MEFDFRMIDRAFTTENETLCAKVSNGELEKLCRDRFQATEP